jgi:hypothetical protein
MDDQSMIDAWLKKHKVTKCPQPAKPDYSEAKGRDDSYAPPETDLLLPERKLARAKILVMLQECGGRLQGSDMQLKGLNIHTRKAQALHWFCSRDCAAWCDDAGFCVEIVRNKAKEIYDNGWPFSKAKAGTGMRYLEKKLQREKLKQKELV